VDTSWQDRYLRINDKDWAEKFSQCGHLAPNKRLPTVNVSKKTAESLISGLNADADVRDNVFSTTSQTLALQMRVLYRLLGQSCHLTRIDDHGGLGTNPIYRLTPRSLDTNRKYPRIRAISEGGECRVMDITVEGGRFYLPESDVIVHNCDEFATYQSAIITNELKTNPFFGSDFGLIKSAKVLTVAWLKTGGRTWQGNELGYGGHNVCLIEFRDGTFAYMDYGLPSKNVESIELVAKQVLGVYSPISECIGLAVTGLDLKLHNYKFGV
jgi:hypothetical protein